MSGIGYVVKSMVVKLKQGTAAAVAYECAITGITENPTSDVQTSRTACADGTITDVGPTSWTVTVAYNVSNLPASFHRLLREHDGEAATLTVEPFPVTEPGHEIEYAVILSPGGAGYVVGTFGAATAELPCTADPKNIDPTP